MKRFSVGSEAQDGKALIRPVGDLDLSSAQDLAEAIEAALDADNTEIEVDLSGVSFVDSTGLRILIEATTKAEQRSARLSLTKSGDQFRRLVELTRTAGTLGLE